MSKQNMKRTVTMLGLAAVAVGAGSGMASAAEQEKAAVGPYKCATAIPLLSDDLLLASGYLGCSESDPDDPDTNVHYQSRLLGLELPDKKGPALGLSILPKKVEKKDDQASPGKGDSGKPGGGSDSGKPGDGGGSNGGKPGDNGGSGNGGGDSHGDGHGKPGGGDGDGGGSSDSGGFPGGDNSDSDSGGDDGGFPAPGNEGRHGGDGGINVHVGRSGENMTPAGSVVGGQQLAHTGSSNTTMGAGLAGGALLALGAGAVMYKRRQLAA